MSDVELGERMVAALTREIPNYAGRVADAIGAPESELWAIHLAVVGKVRFPNGETVNHGLRALVPDSELSNGRGRYHVWRLTILEILSILGDKETFNRTGWSSSQLQLEVDRFFSDAAK
ncbi:MAG: hypothetical protein ACT4P1_16645 [Sporichthyaceae bacterium]